MLVLQDATMMMTMTIRTMETTRVELLGVVVEGGEVQRPVAASEAQHRHAAHLDQEEDLRLPSGLD